jgi:hypothetical protein
VQTLSDSLRASLLNAMPPRSRGSIACSHIELFFHVISKFSRLDNILYRTGYDVYK